MSTDQVTLSMQPLLKDEKALLELPLGDRESIAGENSLQLNGHKPDGERKVDAVIIISTWIAMSSGVIGELH